MTGVSGKTRSAAMLTSPGVDHFLSRDFRTFFIGCCSTFCFQKHTHSDQSRCTYSFMSIQRYMPGTQNTSSNKEHDHSDAGSTLIGNPMPEVKPTNQCGHQKLLK